MKPNNKQRGRVHLHPIMWVVVGISIASVLIFIVAMLIPPPGDVNTSVLKGIGLLTAQQALAIFAHAVISGKTATFSHGQTKATVGASPDKPAEDEPTTETENETE